MNYEQFKGHTSGPWYAYQVMGSICIGDAREVKAIEDIKKILHIEILGGENIEADSRLIAAAPDLLAEHRRLRKALEFYADKNTWSNARFEELNRNGGFFPYGIEECPIAEDGGEIAHAALQEERQ